MKSDKIDNLLIDKKLKYTDLARYLGRFKQSVFSTRRNGAWTGDDLIKIAELTKTNLAFINKEGEIIEAFNVNDLTK